MPGEPFRFLHASQLRLDEPLAGTGPLDGESRRVAEDATLSALENIVDACLAEGVEFLVLTGETFGSGPATLRARRALVTAFENLCEFEIQVFWETGRGELAGIDIPDNVTPIHPGDGEPVPVIRQGRVMASIGMARIDGAAQPAGGETDRDERGTFRVAVAGPGLTQVFEGIPGPDDSTDDYVALSGTGQRMTRRSAAGVVHNPGPAQGTRFNETGVNGATLVRVDADRTVELTVVPTAPVRRERIMVGVERHLTCEQLAERMQSALLELEPSTVERLWIVNWQMIGSSDLFDALQSGSAIDELVEAVNRRLATGNDIRRVDRFHFRRRLEQHADELCGEIAAWIRGSDADPVADVVRELENVSRAHRLRAVQEVLPLIDRGRVRDDAARLSQELLLHSGETRREQAER